MAVKKKTTKKRTTKKTTKKRAASKAASKAPKMTIKELQSWLSGVTEFTGADWTPTAEQWKVILKKINCLVSEEPQIVEKIVEVSVDSGSIQPPNIYRQTFTDSGQPQTNALDIPNASVVEGIIKTDLITQAPSQPQLHQQGTPIEPAPAPAPPLEQPISQALPSNVIVPPDMKGVEVISSGSIHKGKFIDNSKSDYVSGFE